MPVVMLLLILMPLTMAGELCMLCQCLFLGRGRARRRLALLAGAVLLLLAVWLGGGALLETAGLGWRRWVSGGLVAAAAIAAAALALLLPREHQHHQLMEVRFVYFLNFWTMFQTSFN